MDRFKKAVKFLQDNFNLIILIPTVLGGFWQLIELLRIDTSFVRFFSITQVISDGLILMFLLICSYLIYIYIFKIHDIKSSDNEVKIPYDYLLFKYIILFIFIIMLSIWFWTIESKKITTSSFFFVFSFFVLCIKVFRDIVLQHFGKDGYRYLNATAFILVFLCIHYNDLFFKNFHKMYFLPFNLKNTKYIECYIGKNKNEFELLYFNDKYIFVQIKKTKEIEIINFDEMFKKDNCK
ncbi:hypothetical protein EQG63_11260 [Flavobacterium amnicola]|uniref:Uncharacterized protein n=1 Tax=Flavobacterium amnicola TaxID=2506422 RepID=A0A4Q1K173_9FLAO|nr:hypothetical protein [Flavobacterium amnicola]RXR17359.1 hypothetical protein EQG63_11260 [Flavobacterium amnicola]